MKHETNTGRPADLVPRQPIHKLTEPLARFLHIQTASGVVLLAASVVALIAANSPISEEYLAFWKTKVGFSFGDFEFRHSLKHLINDALMTVFFFVVGLEVKREIVLGELRDRRQADVACGGGPRRDAGPGRNLSGIPVRRGGCAGLGNPDGD